MFRDAARGPLGEGRGAGLLDRVLRDLEVTYQAGDGRDRRPPVGPENLLRRLAQPGTSRAGICTTGRTSTDPLNAVGTVAAQRRASSRPAHSISV
jgi:hypothetical protein